MTSLKVDEHGRDSLAQRYVYSVLSRRAGGISLGVNLNPDRICNWACAYCQVAREDEPKTRVEVDADRACDELTDLLESVADGSILDHPLHRGLPEDLAKVVDLSFSGDGEPTTSVHFSRILDHSMGELRRLNLDLNLVVLSNNSLVHRPAVRSAVERLGAFGGRLHVKLDGGDEAAYRRVDRTSVPWARTTSNLVRAAQLAPVVVQTLICSVDEVFMGTDEAHAYARLLGDVLDQGGEIEAVDLHTVARQPPFDGVKALPLSYLEALAVVMQREEPRLAQRLRCTAGHPRYLLANAPVDLPA